MNRALLIATIAAVLSAGPTSTASAAQQPLLLVSGYNSNTVHTFDPATGLSQGSLGFVPGAQSARYGPDGDLYVCAEKQDEILRFDGTTGALSGPFVFDDPNTPADETGGLSGPTAAEFGPDGSLYVASFNGDSVLRYDGATGAFLGAFVPPQSGGLDGPDAGMTFGPDGHLYVPSFNSDQVLRYDGTTGAFLGVFAGPNPGGLSRPRMLRFRSNGWLYVTSWGSNRILRYDADGSFRDAFVVVTRPTGFAFGPDDGDLYVTSDQSGSVRRYDGRTGAFVGVLVPAGTGGLNGGTFVELLPDPEVRLERLQPGLAGGANLLRVRNATPDSFLVFGVGLQGASTPLAPCKNYLFGVGNPIPFVLPTDASGTAQTTASLGSAFSGVTLYLQAFDLVNCLPSNLVLQTL